MLCDAKHAPGRYPAVWDEKNHMGLTVPSGPYVNRYSEVVFMRSYKMISIK